MANQFQEYPKRMAHPQHQPAEWKSLGETQGLMAADTVMVKPERFPDVTVFTRDQEAQYAARGYRPNNVPDQAEYERAILDAQPSVAGGVQDYPRWLYHPTEIPVIVKTAAEEKALGAEWSRTPILATEEDLDGYVALPMTHHVAVEPPAAPAIVEPPTAKKAAGRPRKQKESPGLQIPQFISTV